VLSVVGARPNFVKIAPILRALRARAGERSLAAPLVHTEQHYDDAMSAAFLADLEIGTPDYTLGVGSGSHATQTAEVMKRVEPVLQSLRPDVVLVVGDVNSTIACALTAAKLGCRVAHVEAGLRSFDRSMPEEINRLLTDAISDFLFTTEDSANENLRREGHAPEKVFFVGNVMIDSLLWCRRLAARSQITERLGLNGTGRYAVVTLHRPSNVDRAPTLRALLETLAVLARDLPVILPLHPRTRARIAEYDLERYLCRTELDGNGAALGGGRITVLDPVGYVDFFRLMSGARLVLTDSGGIQEETTCLGIPCLTLRENTERPITVSHGTNTVTGTDPERILDCARSALNDGPREARRPPLWDGRAAERIVDTLMARC
jgi:UDP-N-acetylglucosamine 2-epimerase (non-hydrolysing)